MSGSDDNTLKVWSAVTGKVSQWVVLLNSLGNELQVEHRYVRNAAAPSDGTAGWSLVSSGARIRKGTSKHFGSSFPAQKLVWFRKVTLM